MKKQRIKAKVADLILNEGQLSWLPKNPRQWTRTDIDKTVQSLKRDPDFQEDNPLKVVQYEDKLLVFAGNLRSTGARELKWDTFEAILYTPENEEDYETIKRRAILDNGSFGSWDWDALGNEWDDMPLADFGVPVWGVKRDDLNVDDFFEEAMAHKEKKEGDIIIEVVIPREDSDTQVQVEEIVKAALAEYPNVKVQR